MPETQFDFFLQSQTQPYLFNWLHAWLSGVKSAIAPPEPDHTQSQSFSNSSGHTTSGHQHHTNPEHHPNTLEGKTQHPETELPRHTPVSQEKVAQLVSFWMAQFIIVSRKTPSEYYLNWMLEFFMLHLV